MGFLPAGFTTQNLETRANEVINKVNRLGEGKHSVSVESVEYIADKGKSPYLKISMKDKEDTAHSEFIWLVKEIWENGRPTGQMTVSDQIFQMLGAIGLKPSQVGQYLEICSNNPNDFQILIGQKLIINLSKGNRGVDVKRDEEGNLVIVDISSAQTLAETIAEEVGDTVFTDWESVTEFLKERKSILPRAFLKIKTYITDPEAKDDNVKAIQAALQAEAAPVQNNTFDLLR